MSTTKKCTKCSQELSTELFYKDKSQKDGLRSQCKGCAKASRRAYYEANPEKAKASAKAYRAANPEKVKARQKARQKAYREANPEKVKALHKAWREANPEKLAALHKAWREANPEKLAALHKAWREANPEKLAARAKAYYEANPELMEMRRVICRANRGDIPSLKIYGLPNREMVKQVRDAKLAIYRKAFGERPHHLDHMRPLAGAKGNTAQLHQRSRFSNLVYLPAEVNREKSATPFWQWFAELEDQQLKTCIAAQDIYNKQIERSLINS